MELLTTDTVTRTKTKHILLYARIRRACLMHRAINNFYCREALAVLRKEEYGLCVTDICIKIFGENRPDLHSLTSRSLTSLLKFNLVLAQPSGSHVIYRLNGPRINKINNALRKFHAHTK